MATEKSYLERSCILCFCKETVLVRQVCELYVTIAMSDFVQLLQSCLGFCSALPAFGWSDSLKEDLPPLSLSWGLELHRNALWKLPWHYLCPNGHKRYSVKYWLPGSWPGLTVQRSHSGWVHVGLLCLSGLKSRTSVFNRLSLHNASLLLSAHS